MKKIIIPAAITAAVGIAATVTAIIMSKRNEN